MAATGAIQFATVASQRFPGAQKGGITEREGLVYVHPHELISPIEKLPAVIKQSFPQLAGQQRKRSIFLTVPIYIGGDQIDEKVIEIIESASYHGHINISARALK
jgi:hypothetical protein